MIGHPFVRGRWIACFVRVIITAIAVLSMLALSGDGAGANKTDRPAGVEQSSRELVLQGRIAQHDRDRIHAAIIRYFFDRNRVDIENGASLFVSLANEDPRPDWIEDMKRSGIVCRGRSTWSLGAGIAIEISEVESVKVGGVRVTATWVIDLLAGELVEFQLEEGDGDWVISAVRIVSVS